MVNTVSAVAALDAAVAAFGQARKAQCELESATEQAHYILQQAQLNAQEAERVWRDKLEAFVHEHGHLIHDADTRGWMIHHLEKTLGWSAEMIHELEETTRWR